MTFSGRLSSEPDLSSIIKRLSGFQSGAYRQCPICQQSITHVSAYYGTYDPECCTLYCHPCDCRLGRWVGVPQWLRDMNGVVEYRPDDDSEDEPDDEWYLDNGILPDNPTDEYWKLYHERQEGAGQLRLFDDESEDRP